MAPTPPLSTIYTGPTIPPAYDPRWPSFTNLTPAQIAVFQSFPEDLIKYLGQMRWQYEIRAFPASMNPQPNPYITIGGIPIYTLPNNLTLITALAVDAGLNPGDTYNFTVGGVVYNLTAAQAVGLFNGVRSYIQQCRDVEATCINGINAKTITSRAQIDAALAALN